MPKTRIEIWKEFSESLGTLIEVIGSKTRIEGWVRPYQEENRDDKFYSEEEILKAIDKFGFCCNDNDCKMAKDMRNELKKIWGLKR